MKVLLINVDSKLPNLALAKLERWHRDRGDDVTYDLAFLRSADRVYGSCIVSRNLFPDTSRRYRNLGQSSVLEFLELRPDAVWGGTGYDPSVRLSAEVEAVKPKINYGFTVRGCTRHCPWCLAERDVRIVGDIYDLWDGRSDCLTLFDDNVLAVPDHFEHICSQVSREGLTVDFNQGLDIRLVTARVIRSLNTVRMRRLRFSFDSPGLEDIVRAKVPLLRCVKRDPFCYVLVGFDTTFEEDLYRLAVLKELGCRPYVMRHENTPKERRYMRLAQWVNQIWTFQKYDFDAFRRVKGDSVCREGLQR